MASEKAPLLLQRFDTLEFVPRFEYGEMAVSALIHFAIHPSNWHQVE